MCDLAAMYKERRKNYLVPLAEKVERHIKSRVSYPAIVAISSRAKAVESYCVKAAKLNEDGSPKYPDPVNDILDQIGARIVIKFRSQLNEIETLVRESYRFIEIDWKEPEKDNQFGYFGLHFLLTIPPEVIPDDFLPESMPRVFELQIKTLFQHAWSEAEHDITYKPSFEWSKDDKRRIAFTAAQAWGADTIFDELYQASFNSKQRN